jgi:hypothetical protein
MARWAIDRLRCPCGQAGRVNRRLHVRRGATSTRRFFVSNYQGSTIERVALAHNAAAGRHDLAHMRLNTFDGTFPHRDRGRDITTGLDLGVRLRQHRSVGSLVTFTQTLVAGAGLVYYDTAWVRAPTSR